MALINPQSLYSGEQGILRDDYVNFVARQQAQKQAKQEALDKAMGDRLARLTSTGMRQEEIPALMRLKDQIQDYYIKNRDTILNPSKDGGRTWGELNSMYNRGYGLTDASKAAVKPETDFYGLSKNPDIVDRIDQNTFAQFDKHKQPIAIVDPYGNVVDNPNHVPFDVSKVVFNPKEYTAKELDDYYKHKEATYGKERLQNVTYSPTSDKYRNLETTTSTYGQPSLQKIADEAINDYNSDKRLSYTFRKGHDLLKTPLEDWTKKHIDQYNELNGYYKQAYGKDAAITTPQELHAAEIIKKASQPLIDTKTVENEAQKVKDRERLAYLNDALIRGRAKKGEEDELGYPTVEWAKKFGFTINRTNPDGTVSNTGDLYIDADELPKGFMDVVNPTDINKNLYPVRPLFSYNDSKTGKVRNVYKYDPETGAWIGSNGRIDPDYARDQYMNKLLPTKFKVKMGSKGKFDYEGQPAPKLQPQMTLAERMRSLKKNK